MEAEKIKVEDEFQVIALQAAAEKANAAQQIAEELMKRVQNRLGISLERQCLGFDGESLLFAPEGQNDEEDPSDRSDSDCADRAAVCSDQS